METTADDQDESFFLDIFRQVAYLAVVLVAAGAILSLMWISWRIVHNNAYMIKTRDIRERIVSLESRKPPDIDEAAWKGGVGWLVTAHCNICFSPEHVTYRDMADYGRELEEKRNGDVDLSTLVWIWDRLSQTSVHGQKYTLRYRDQFDATIHDQPPNIPRS